MGCPENKNSDAKKCEENEIKFVRTNKNSALVFTLIEYERAKDFPVISPITEQPIVIYMLNHVLITIVLVKFTGGFKKVTYFNVHYRVPRRITADIC